MISQRSEQEFDDLRIMVAGLRMRVIRRMEEIERQIEEIEGLRAELDRLEGKYAE